MKSDTTITSGLAQLAVDAQGTGIAVVFLHAGVADRRMWRAQLLHFGATHQAIAYDRRGFGGTRAEPEGHSSVADLIDNLACDAPAILVGCSQGARVAVDAALKHPLRIKALVLISPAVSGAPPTAYDAETLSLMEALEDAEATGDLDRVNALEAHLWLDGPMEPQGRVGGEQRQLFLDMNGVALRSPPVGADLDTDNAFDRLGEILAPTLLIGGDCDLPHIQARCQHMAQVMPNASLHMIPGTAHLPSLERPTKIALLISNFIAGWS
jgi:pimeloyl-ACP methyl ester carboxylesterase